MAIVDWEDDAPQEKKATQLELTDDEKNGILQLINYVIDKRVNGKATTLSYTELLNLKNKLHT